MINNGWNWDLTDYIVAGFLIATITMIASMVIKKVPNPRKRLLVIGLIMLGCIYVWAELAVGIFTNLGS